MVNMEIINDAELLMNIAGRYKLNLIFTYVGPTLLVVNPFQSIPVLFTPEIKASYIGKIALNKGNYIYKCLRWSLQRYASSCLCHWCRSL